MINANPSIAFEVILPCIAMYPETLAVWYHFFVSNLLSDFIDPHGCFFDFSQLWDTFCLNDHDIPCYLMISHDIPPKQHLLEV